MRRNSRTGKRRSGRADSLCLWLAIGRCETTPSSPAAAAPESGADFTCVTSFQSRHDRLQVDRFDLIHRTNSIRCIIAMKFSWGKTKIVDSAFENALTSWADWSSWRYLENGVVNVKRHDYTSDDMPLCTNTDDSYEWLLSRMLTSTYQRRAVTLVSTNRQMNFSRRQ